MAGRIRGLGRRMLYVSRMMEHYKKELGIRCLVVFGVVVRPRGRYSVSACSDWMALLRPHSYMVQVGRAAFMRESPADIRASLIHEMSHVRQHEATGAGEEVTGLEEFVANLDVIKHYPRGGRRQVMRWVSEELGTPPRLFLKYLRGRKRRDVTKWVWVAAGTHASYVVLLERLNHNPLAVTEWVVRGAKFFAVPRYSQFFFAQYSFLREVCSSPTTKVLRGLNKEYRRLWKRTFKG